MSLIEMNEYNEEKVKKNAQVSSAFLHLDETDVYILLTLLENSKITNTQLAKMLEFKDGNSVAYHIRGIQKEGIIDRYTIVPNWKRMGLATEFIILAETDNEEQLLEIEKKHVIMADEYAKENNDFVVTPTISGCVILQNVYHCFGDKTMGIIIGRATSDQDAAVYCKNYLVTRYPNIKVSLLINKYKTISDFFIDNQAIETLKNYFNMTQNEQSGDVLQGLHKINFEE